MCLKKFVSFSSVLVLSTLLIGGNIQAKDFDTTLDQNLSINMEDISLHSEQFPSAYFEYDVVDADEVPESLHEQLGLTNEDAQDVVIVKAEAYVEETYDKVDGKVICTSSKLLSEDEVNKFGKSSFNDLDSVQTLSSFDPYDEASKGKLSLFVTLSTKRNSGSYKILHSVNGTATWSGISALTPSKGPASGLDFAGFVWGGSLSSSGASAGGNTYLGEYDPGFSVAKSSPQVGYVWQFDECQDVGHVLDYLTEFWASINLYKKSSLSGEDTSVVFQYTHTYQSSTGSISLSASGPSFSLGSCSNSWDLCCTINGVEY